MFGREMTMIDTVLLVVGAILVIGFALYLLDRMLLWMEHRGWIYWRKTKRATGPGVGNALLEIQTLMEPSARHVLEYRHEVKDESPEPADPPSEDPPSGPLEDTDTRKSNLTSAQDEERSPGDPDDVSYS